MEHGNSSPIMLLREINIPIMQTITSFISVFISLLINFLIMLVQNDFLEILAVFMSLAFPNIYTPPLQ